MIPALQRLPAAALQRLLWSLPCKCCCGACPAKAAVKPALRRLPAAALQAGFLLTLSIPDDDRFLDDKLDVLELNGLQQTSTFTLFPNRAPSQEMTAFLRLMNLQGEAEAAAHQHPHSAPRQALPQELTAAP